MVTELKTFRKLAGVKKSELKKIQDRRRKI